MKKTRLSDIFNADSIRNKKRILDRFEINKKEKRLFLDAIEEIENNEGGSCDKVVLEEKDCNFYDYDGTLLYSYTKEEALALTELPPLPTQPGLICQEWNWDLEDIKESLNEINVCDIGAIYTTDNGETRLYVKIYDDTKNIKMLLRSKNGTVTIDWGDGIIDVLDCTHNYNPNSPDSIRINPLHNYTEIGNYCIKITTTIDDILILGGVTTTDISGIFSAQEEKKSYQHILIKAFIGDNVDLYEPFQDACFLECVTLPNHIGYRYHCLSMNNCSTIKHINIPKNTSIFANGFAFNNNLEIICFSKSVTNGPQDDLYNNTNSYTSCYSLKHIYLKYLPYKSVTFRNNHSLNKIILNDLMTTINSYAFNECLKLKEIKVPKNVNSINMYAFDIPIGGVVDFSACVNIPSLINSGIEVQKKQIPYATIIVPDVLYDEWIAATNWANYAEIIIKQSEYAEIQK